MITSSEIDLPSQEITAEKEALLRTLPSTDAFYQEGTKIIGASAALPMDAIARTLATQLPSSSLDQLRLMNPGLEGASNMAKVRAVRAATVHQLVGDAALLSWPTADKALGLLMTDQATRNTARAVFSRAEQETDRDMALSQDINFIRARAGDLLVQRLGEGRVAKGPAVAFASALESRGSTLTAIEKAQIINFVINSPDAPSIKLLGSRTDPAVIQGVITEARLRSIVISQALDLHRRPADLDHVPLSNLAPVMNQTMAEFHQLKTTAGLKDCCEQIVAKERLPDKIQSLTQVVEMVDNHPELKAVSFDLYDTLISWTSNQVERRGRMNEVSVDLLKRKYGLTVNVGDFQRVADQAWTKRWDDFQAKGVEVELPATLSWMIDPILSGPQGAPLQARKAEIIKDLEKAWYNIELDTAVVVPEAEQTLRELKARGIKIGVTSNASWTQDHMRRVLHHFKLLPHLDAVSFSSEIGVMKDPNRPEFFHHSWNRLNARPEEVLHIGDNPYADVQGARNAGGKATHYNNPTACAEIEINPWYYSHPEDYKTKAAELYRKTQNHAALYYIEQQMAKQGIPMVERERVRTMAKEVYQKTRDVVGPAYVALSDTLLQRLSQGESDLNLVLARDGLPLAIAQKLLLSKEPDHYPGATADQIKYVYLSRRLIDSLPADSALKARVEAYLKQKGTDKAQKITVSDLTCSSGKTHQGIKGLLPGKQVEGHYIDVALPDKFPDAHSFLKEKTGNFGMGLSNDNMLLLFEALFSGPFESPTDIDDDRTGLLGPEMKRKALPPEVLVRGLSEPSLLMLNQIAIKGLQDAVDTLHRHRLLKLPDPSADKIMQRFFSFIQSPPREIWVDIWRTLPWQDGRWVIASQMENDPAVPGAMNSKIK